MQREAVVRPSPSKVGTEVSVVDIHKILAENPGSDETNTVHQFSGIGSTISESVPSFHKGKEVRTMCIYCFQSMNPSVLDEHLRSHNILQRFKCQSCNLSFSDANSLEHHAMTHYKVKPYICTKCSKTYETKPGLRLHMKWHDDRTLCFECKVCMMKFRQERLLENHMRLVHPFVKFEDSDSDN